MTGDEVKKETMCMGDKSDIEIANEVRMLMRNQINHEAVCTAGRDRIMYLNQKLERMKVAAIYLCACVDTEDLKINSAIEEFEKALAS